MSDLAAALDEYLEPEEADPEKETPPEEEETPAAEAETVEEPEEETEEEPTVEEPQRDPAIQAYLDKYGGDTEKAIAAALEAQKLIGKQGEELGELRKLIETRLPEEEEQYVPMDNSTMQWFDTLMDENPVQAMEWARKNDPSGTYYNRGLEQWFDVNPRAAFTYQLATVVKGLRDEFASTLSERTKPYQEQHQQQTIQQAWMIASRENPDIANHADAILQEAKDSPELLRGAESAEAQAKAIHKLYRLVKGAAATTLEAATQEAETEQKQANRSAKLSGTTPQTKAVTPEPDIDPGEQWLEDIGFNAVLDSRYSDE